MIYKIGIDVGGTNTDAVILDENNSVVESIKSPTTLDVESGIVAAVEGVLKKTNIELRNIRYVMLGTTHATNAIIERKNLAKIACVRICLPAGGSIEPMFSWDDSLKAAVGNQYYLLHGGCEFDGRPLNSEGLMKEECVQVLNEIKHSEVESIAITSIFSPVLDSYEKELEQMAKEILGEDFPITLSYEIGNLGLLERESSAALNASLVKVINKVAIGLQKALARYGVDAEIFFTQNDGTLMSIEFAKKYPILTIGSGPTNSIRGAAYLTGLEECIVCDIGGTSTDIGILIKGFPRQSSVSVEIGGVRTNFRMPDIISIGIGGGSIVREDNGRVTVGPDSVGYNIIKDSIAFGGDTLTATDCLLAAGLAKINHPNCDVARLASIKPEVIENAISFIQDKVSVAVDRIKTKKEEIPVVLVGGGSILVPGDIEGASEVVRPQYSGCANALGAAIAQVSGDLDKIFSTEGKSREEVIKEAKDQVVQKTIDAGADPTTVEIIEFEEVPIAYLPSNVIRIKTKAAGKLLNPTLEVTNL